MDYLMAEKLTKNTRQPNGASHTKKHFKKSESLIHIDGISLRR